MAKGRNLALRQWQEALSMKKPSKYLAPAILLTLMPFMFRFDGADVTWSWADNLPVAVFLLASGAAFWGLYLRARIRAAH